MRSLTHIIDAIENQMIYLVGHTLNPAIPIFPFVETMSMIKTTNVNPEL
jgi:hypothetical protein